MGLFRAAAVHVAVGAAPLQQAFALCGELPLQPGGAFRKQELDVTPLFPFLVGEGGDGPLDAVEQLGLRRRRGGGDAGVDVMQVIPLAADQLGQERHASVLEGLFELRPGEAVHLDQDQPALVIRFHLGKAQQPQGPFAPAEPSPHLAQARVEHVDQAGLPSMASAPTNAVPAAWAMLPRSFHSIWMRRMAPCQAPSSGTSQAAFFLMTEP